MADPKNLGAQFGGRYPIIESSWPDGSRRYTAVDPENAEHEEWSDEYGDLAPRADRIYDELDAHLRANNHPTPLEDYFNGDLLDSNRLADDIYEQNARGKYYSKGYRVDPEAHAIYYNDTQEELWAAPKEPPKQGVVGAITYAPNRFQPQWDSQTYINQVEAQARATGKPVQMEMFSHTPEQIKNFGVRDFYQKKGVGKDLANHAVQAAYDSHTSTTSPGDFPPLDEELTTDSAGMAEHLYGSPVPHVVASSSRNAMSDWSEKVSRSVHSQMAAEAYRQQVAAGRTPEPGDVLFDDKFMGHGRAAVVELPATSLEQKIKDVHAQETRERVLANVEQQRQSPLRSAVRRRMYGVQQLPGMEDRPLP